MPIPKYQDWDAAVRASKWAKAVSKAFKIEEPGTGKVRRVEIIKPQYGDPVVVYASTSIPVRNFKVTAKLVDSIREWRAY